MNHPEGLPDDHREIIGHEVLKPGTADYLLSQVLRQFGVTEYVLVVRGGCQHGHLHLETHSAGLDPPEVKSLLVDAAAAFAVKELGGG